MTVEHNNNFELSMLHGSSVSEVRISEEEIDLLFRPDGSVGVHGHWELRDREGNLVDQACPIDERETLRLHQLIGRTVTGSEIPAPRSFRLHFDNGFALYASEYSRAYRSFSVHPDLQPRKSGR